MPGGGGVWLGRGDGGPPGLPAGAGGRLGLGGGGSPGRALLPCRAATPRPDRIQFVLSGGPLAREIRGGTALWVKIPG